MAIHPYDKSTPCDNCPFLKSDKAVRVRQARAKEIAESPDTFYCHKTTSDDAAIGKKSKACAGWLIFMNKVGPNKIMRIAQTLGVYNPKELLANKENVERVCDSLDELLELHGET